jgi:hypothetical protein
MTNTKDKNTKTDLEYWTKKLGLYTVEWDPKKVLRDLTVLEKKLSEKMKDYDSSIDTQNEYADQKEQITELV